MVIRAFPGNISRVFHIEHHESASHDFYDLNQPSLEVVEAQQFLVDSTEQAPERELSSPLARMLLFHY